MVIDEGSTVIDNDVINRIAEMDKSCEEMADIVRAVFQALKLDVIIHPLVYKNEVMHTDGKTAYLFDQKLIAVPETEDIYQSDPTKKAYYERVVRELFYRLNGRQLDEAFKRADQKEAPKVDVFTDWKRGISLGEIHSLGMCLVCGCKLFLSDDSDARKLRKDIEDSAMGAVEVLSRRDIAERLPEGVLVRRDRKAFAHER